MRSTRQRRIGSGRSSYRRHGRTSGSAPGRTATSRRSGRTRPAGDSTSTIRRGTRPATATSTSGSSPWPGVYRRPAPRSVGGSAGPGWALVGDAGYFKDPLTAHGITDALVDAEYLSRAIADGTDAALIAYAQDRDRRAARLFDITDRIASFKWSLDEARVLHKQLARAMADEVTALLTFTNEAIPA